MYLPEVAFHSRDGVECMRILRVKTESRRLRQSFRVHTCTVSVPIYMELLNVIYKSRYTVCMTQNSWFLLAITDLSRIRVVDVSPAVVFLGVIYRICLV